MGVKMITKLVLASVLVLGLLFPFRGVVAQDGWTTYTNPAHNFSIDYPSDWIRTETTHSFYTMVTLVGPQDKGIEVSVQAIELIAPIELKRLTTEGQILYATVTTEGFNVGKHKQRQSIIAKDGIVYVISCLTYPTSFQEADAKYFTRMIDSFKVG